MIFLEELVREVLLLVLVMMNSVLNYGARSYDFVVVTRLSFGFLKLSVCFFFENFSREFVLVKIDCAPSLRVFYMT